MDYEGRGRRGKRGGRIAQSGRGASQRGRSGPIRITRTTRRFHPYDSADVSVNIDDILFYFLLFSYFFECCLFQMKSPFTRRSSKADQSRRWEHDLYETNEVNEANDVNTNSASSRGTKIRITNLHYSVREEDLIVCFLLSWNAQKALDLYLS